jgi:hypothetical protein
VIERFAVGAYLDFGFLAVGGQLGFVSDEFVVFGDGLYF